MFLKPTRDLFILQNGSFVYFELTAQKTKLKAFFLQSQINKVTRKGMQIILETVKKTYLFFFETRDEAESWRQHFALVCIGNQAKWVVWTESIKRNIKLCNINFLVPWNAKKRQKA